MIETTVYVVYNEQKDLYYGQQAFWLVPLKDAKIFSKRHTATACCNRIKKCKVIRCTLTVHLKK